MSNDECRMGRLGGCGPVKRGLCIGFVVATLAIAVPSAQALVVGACCLPSGTCTVTVEIVCLVQNGLYRGNGTTCAGVVCTGACCSPTEGCAVVSSQSCTLSAGEFKGFGSTCGECPEPAPAAFTYQGQLKQNGRPLDDFMDMRFSLWRVPTGNDPTNRIGSAQLVPSIEVVNGLFSVELDFGANALDGTARWLQIEIHDPNDPPGAFTLLSPRQSLTPTPYALQTRGIFVREDGNVGIGTKAPTSKLEIIGQNGFAITGPKPFLTLRDTAAGGARGIIAGDAGDINFYPHNFIGGSPLLTLRSFLRNVGVGTTAPIGGLHVNHEPLGSAGTLSLEGSTHTYIGFYPQGAGAGRKAWLGFGGAGTNQLSLVNDAGGNINLVTAAGAATRVNVLEIAGADIAEKFPASEKLEPGMVVAIDKQNPGKLCLAQGVYNRCVAGVVSGANNFSVGAVLGSTPNTKDAPAIALSGRVYVQCDASSGAIEPGDLLTTSDVPGHAMKVIDYPRAQGAIIGKAMTPLAHGESGMVLVLVSLQ